MNDGKHVTTVSAEIAGRTLSLETGLLAEQADGAVVVRYGESMLLAAVCGEREAKEATDFFPLTVDYEEKMYAAGKIPGGFIKREGRPTEAAILAARLTDRPIRPLFPKGYRAEVQVINTVLSADQENDPALLSIIGASAALAISQIPFEGPIGGVQVGYIDGEIVINPTFAQLEESKLNMTVAGTADAIMMVEGEAQEVSEETMLEGIVRAHEVIRQLTALQEELVAKVGKPKWEYTPPAKNAELYAAVEKVIGAQLSEAVNNPDKVVRLEGTNTLKDEVLSHFDAQDGETWSRKEIGDVFDAMLKAEVRGGILNSGTRPDGRKPDEIRPIWSQVGYLPRAHGSAIFTRGQTQVLTVVTLGSTAEEQRLDSISPEVRKRYIHHYNFPPFSVGEVRRLRGAGRREIGHGALAERALLAVLPSEEDFPYTLRLVSEVVSSNGSTSMASVCGSTLALMDAGVPIAKPVAGMAMGLVTDGESADRYTVLSDIQGMEDALGDMDFKVAGTKDGVTAIQMDIKVKGITPEIMREALEQAHKGRIFILGKMAETLAEPRETLSTLAPRVSKIKINPEKIGLLIGPGGKNIRSLQEETSTKIDIQDDGTVLVSGDSAGADKAVQRILGMTTEVKVERGEIYNGKVVSIQPYGAFVELLPGRDGLVHISELSEDPAVRVAKVEDVVNLGDEITVMVTDVAPNGKVSLSRRAALTGELPEQRPQAPRRDDRGPRGPRPDGPRRDGNRPPRQ